MLFQYHQALHNNLNEILITFLNHIKVLQITKKIVYAFGQPKFLVSIRYAKYKLMLIHLQVCLA
jgi:hypothetical protein